jgi:hypothetical protein
VNDVLLYLPAEDCMADAGPDQLLLNWVARDRLSSMGQPPEFSLPHALHYEANVITAVLFSGFGLDGIDTFALNSGTSRTAGFIRATADTPSSCCPISQASMRRRSSCWHRSSRTVARSSQPA